jgi:carbamoyl-phosphate synthase large subunit
MTTRPGPPNALAGQRVLVTGGAGVIAGELSQLLSAAGADVLSVDRLALPAAAPPGVDHVVADLAVASLDPIAAFRPRYMFHLAATFERSVESPEFWGQNWSDNVVATHRLVELADGSADVEAFVFASSYLVYDAKQYSSVAAPTEATAMSEQSPIRPRNLCGAAKLYGEAELGFMRHVRRAGFRTVFPRIFRVYGRGSRDVVSRWVRAALAGDAVDVYHPENRFDYIFSGDVADGLIRLATTPEAVGAINLGSGRARPVADVIAAIERATGAQLDTRRRDVDEPFEASCADVRRLRAVLDWLPPTSLETGVDRLVAHERAHSQEVAPVAADR